MDCLEYTCEMRVSFSLLTNSQDDRASPWQVVAIVFQVVGARDRLMMYVPEGRSKRHPLGATHEALVFAAEFSHSSFLVLHSVGFD